MNILQINSSIRGNDSISSRYANEIAQKLAKNGNILIKRDLATQPVEVLSPQNLSDVFNNKATDYVRKSDELIEELLATDILVLGVPMYNFAIPVQLKNYIDTIARAGKTFHYTEQGSIGLTHIQKAYVVLSRGGIYDHEVFDSQEKYLTMMLQFIGVKEVQFFFIEGLNMGADAVNLALSKVEQELVQLNI